MKLILNITIEDRDTKYYSVFHGADNLSIENFNFTEGTSPHKVTEPIAAQGINTLLMETCITNSLQEKHNTAEKLIYTLDNLKK